MDPTINRRAPRLIPVARPSITEAEVQAVAEAVRSGWISGGPRVQEFERQFAEAHGACHGVACNSGTTALHLALYHAGIGRGDLVLLPTLTMVAVANAVLYCGATPVFMDSHETDGNADPKTIPLSAWWRKRRFRAAIVPHLYGIPAVDYVNHLRDEYPDTKIIHDCAEAHYATHLGTKLAAFGLGDFATFSFYANKIVTTGEGGMVLLNTGVERMRSLRAHAFTPGNHFHHRELAFGYRMTDLQASVGLAQHERRSDIIARRQLLSDLYDEKLARISWFRRLAPPTWVCYSRRELANWIVPVVLECDAKVDRDVLRHKLGYAGIETRTFFHPLHRQPHLKQFAGRRQFPVADQLSERGLYLPLYPDLQESDVDYIVDAVEAAV